MLLGALIALDVELQLFCPINVFRAEMTNLGDKIAAMATPIARALKMDCIDPVTHQLRSDSGCAKMRNNLNAGMSMQDAIYERWFKAKQEGEKMEYQITVVVQAEKASDAAVKAEAIGHVYSIQERPVQQQRPAGISPATIVRPQT